ncbi:Ultraviolet N-glycosylase/AP lyase [Blastopirellula retiformator]|uniref:Endonuclease III n=1 Tax=Blastopirellula retiformator TaxID=2527970 RepID=A0A5C5UWH3_9BACT|nr:Ultraviolet N-glycosylase/AP lyase [Blastopirellula retiformator]
MRFENASVRPSPSAAERTLPKKISLEELKKQARRVVKQLKVDYPVAECALNYETPYQLLIATILSAQCTDARVNIVTKELFAKYPAADDIAALPIAKIEKLVQTTGFFRNKAKNIKAASQKLVDDYDGEVPQDLEALVALPGVGRKTANVVLGTAFGMPTGVVVDTHVGRLSRRMGLTAKNDAVKVEAELMELLPKKEWIQFSHRMIHHGRAICDARKPKCDDCHFAKFCPQVGVAK